MELFNIPVSNMEENLHIFTILISLIMIEIEQIFRYLLASLLQWTDFHILCSFSSGLSIHLLLWFGFLFNLIYGLFVCCFIFWHINEISPLPVMCVANIFPVLLSINLVFCLLTLLLLGVVWMWGCVWIKAAEKRRGLFKAPKHREVKRVKEQEKKQGNFPSSVAHVHFLLPQES